jgi:2-hydroxychromene-2-carboxylate isomerase
MRTLDFHFDFVSPYACVAWGRIGDICARHECTVHPVPVLFSALLSAHGTKGPAEVPAKRAYVFKDAFRKAHRLGLPPLTPPPSHPFNPLVALRAVTALSSDADRARLTTALYLATWADGTGVETAESVAHVATGAGFDGEALVAAAATPQAKEALRRATDEAIDHGAFGVPTMIVDGELFWGCDALEAVDDFLAGRDPPAGVSLARWTNLPASARRPGS